MIKRLASIKLISIIIIGLLFELLYLFLYFIIQLKFYFNDNNIPSVHGVVILYLMLFAILISIVYIILFKLRKKFEQKNIFIILIIGSVFFSVTLLAIWPVASADIFTYIMQGRVLSVYGGNPYIDTISEYSFDPLADLVFWRWQDKPMVYGPVWGMLGGAIAKISGTNLVTNLFIWRFVLMLFYGASTFLVYKILALTKPTIKYFGTLFYAWNPLLLLQVINNGHNDIVMILIGLLAFYLYLRKKYLAVLPLLVIACLVKYIFILIIPFVFVLLLQNIKHKIEFILKNLILIAFIIILSIIFFDFGKGIIDAFLFQKSLYLEFYLGLLPFILNIININLDVLNKQAIIIFSSFCFVIIYLYVFIKYIFIKNRNWLILNKYIIFILGTYLLTASFFFNEWYYLWLLPFMIFTGQDSYYKIIIIISMAGLLSSNTFSSSLILIMVVCGYLIYKSFSRVFKTIRSN